MKKMSKRVISVAMLAAVVCFPASVFAQAGGYTWNGQQPMMGQMMQQGGMMMPRQMMPQGGGMGHMMNQGAMMGPGSMMGRLTQQQRDEMAKIAGEFAPKFGELQGKMMANQKRMMAMFSAPEIDQAELDSVATEMGGLMSEMIKLRVQHMARMRSLLPQELRQQMGQ